MSVAQNGTGQLAVSYTETGEIVCASCTERISRISELEALLRETERRSEVQAAGDARTIASLSYKLEELRRDKDAEAREHDLWDRALDLFDLWRHLSAFAEGKGKPKRSKLNGERFWLVLPMLSSDGAKLCQQAIAGRTSDHFTATRKNGSTIHYHEWERIFGTAGKNTARKNFEESALRCPEDWRLRIQAAGFEVFE